MIIDYIPTYGQALDWRIDIMNKNYLCCLCGEKYMGYGNNPDGAIDENNEIIEWAQGERCCDACNKTKVIPGRLYLITHRKY